MSTRTAAELKTMPDVVAYHAAVQREYEERLAAEKHAREEAARELREYQEMFSETECKLDGINDDIRWAITALRKDLGLTKYGMLAIARRYEKVANEFIDNLDTMLATNPITPAEEEAAHHRQ